MRTKFVFQVVTASCNISKNMSKHFHKPLVSAHFIDEFLRGRSHVLDKGNSRTLTIVIDGFIWGR